MSWKAVELQVALPRTHDVGQLQEQMQQRGQLVQDQLQQAQLREQLLNRTSVKKMNEKDDLKLTDQEEGNTANDDRQESKQYEKHDEQKESVKHPFLGKFIDYSG